MWLVYTLLDWLTTGALIALTLVVVFFALMIFYQIEARVVERKKRD